MDKKKKILIQTGILSFLIFGLVFRVTAFMWLSGIIIIFILQILTAILPVLAVIRDRNFKTKSIYPALLILLVFWLCYLAQNIIKNHVEKSIETKTEVLITRIESYRVEYGKYPKYLNSPEFMTFDFSTPIGSTINYSAFSDTTFRLSYPAFDGGERIYNNAMKEWYWDD